MRFFFHYNKNLKKMSIHFQKKCHIVKNINCTVPTNTRWSKRQPNIVMCGKANQIVIENDEAVIS